MMFTTPLGLLALLAIPAIVAIHLFRRRFPVRPVAGLFLWQTLQPTPVGGAHDRETADHHESAAGMPGGARLRAHSRGRARLVGRGQPASRRAARRLGVDGGRQRAGRERARPGRAPRARRARSSRHRSAHHPRPQRRASVGPRRPGRLRGRSAARAGGLETGRAAPLARARHSAGAAARRPDRHADGDDGPPAGLAGRRRASKGPTGCRWANRSRNAGIIAAERTTSLDDGRGAVSLALGNYSASPARRRLSVTVPGQTEHERAGPRDRRAAGNLFTHAAAPRGSAGGARVPVRRRVDARQRRDAGGAAAAHRRRRQPPARRPRPAGVDQGARRARRRDPRRVRASAVRRRERGSTRHNRQACGARGSAAHRRRGSPRARPGTSSGRSCWRSVIRCCRA